MPLLERRGGDRHAPRRVRKLRRPTDDWFKGVVSYKGKIQISDEKREVKGTFQMNNRKDQMERELEYQINYEKGFEVVNWQLLPETFKLTLTDFKEKKVLNYTLNRMRATEHFDVANIFGNIIPLETTENNCVPETLAKVFPKLAKQKSNPLEKLKEANTEEIMAFCKEHGIRAIAYNIHNQVIAQNIPITDNKKYATLVYLCYNNHMYLIKNRYLTEKPDAKQTHSLSQNELNEYFKTLIRNRIVPKNIQMDGDDVSSFQHDSIIYYHNEDYDDCLHIVKALMFEDRLAHNIKLNSIMRIIEPIFTSNSALSFLPIRHNKPAFYYNITPNPARELTTIDKNKAYSYALKQLPYLLSTDYRTYECIKTTKFDDEYALYVAEPTTPNILMPKRDIYAGSTIKYCLGKFPFTIHEKLVCKKNENHFSLIVETLMNINPDIAKKIICRTIGSFQSEPKADGITNIIVNEDERNPKHKCIEIEDNIYVEQVPNTNVKSLYNRKPIAIQVKDAMNIMLYEKMEELHLKDEDIVQIRTDAITFYSTHQPIELSTDISGWKSAPYKQSKGSIYDTSYPFDSFFQKGFNKKCVLYTGYAGNGKSYHIQHHQDLTDALILSSKHSAIRQHRERNLKAEVIQKFTANQFHDIPQENTIIVEEVGILDRKCWDFLFKCYMLNKTIICYGDFNQLLPVEEKWSFNRPQFIDFMFATQERMLNNYRNHFTNEYYESLIHGDKEYLRQELQKYSTKTPQEAEVIIAYRNTIVEKYNALIMETTTDTNPPMICNNNDLREKHIYNNFLMKRNEIEEDDLKHFSLAYSRTLYNLQGDSVSSFYVAPEDMDWFLNGRMAYTLISRLKNKHTST